MSERSSLYSAICLRTASFSSSESRQGLSSYPKLKRGSSYACADSAALHAPPGGGRSGYVRCHHHWREDKGRAVLDFQAANAVAVIADPSLREIMHRTDIAARTARRTSFQTKYAGSVWSKYPSCDTRSAYSDGRVLPADLPARLPTHIRTSGGYGPI